MAAIAYSCSERSLEYRRHREGVPRLRDDYFAFPPCSKLRSRVVRRCYSAPTRRAVSLRCEGAAVRCRVRTGGGNALSSVPSLSPPFLLRPHSSFQSNDRPPSPAGGISSQSDSASSYGDVAGCKRSASLDFHLRKSTGTSSLFSPESNHQSSTCSDSIAGALWLADRTTGCFGLNPGLQEMMKARIPGRGRDEREGWFSCSIRSDLTLPFSAGRGQSFDLSDENQVEHGITRRAARLKTASTLPFFLLSTTLVYYLHLHPTPLSSLLPHHLHSSTPSTCVPSSPSSPLLRPLRPPSPCPSTRWTP
jgi:hypothetical protein